MVRRTQTHGRVVDKGPVGIKQAVRDAKKNGARYLVIEPDWDGEAFVVKYVDWMRKPSRHDELLNASGWPMDIRGTFKSWGGETPTVLRVMARTVNNRYGKQIVIACGTKGDKHNALLQRNLLASRGIPTAIGWYRSLDVNGTGFLTLRPMSNKLKMPKPERWRVFEVL